MGLFLNGTDGGGPRLAVVVVNWNGERDTIRCLESLEGSTMPFLGVLVDNHSSGESVSYLRRWLGGVRAQRWILIELAQNRGFCGGYNEGIRCALSEGADAVFVLNNDTIVPPETNYRLWETLQADPKIGAVGPRFLSFEGRPLYRGERLHYRLGIRLGRPARQQISETNFLPGCGMLLRREAIEEVGLFDERFFAYAEDIDLCLRITRAGYKLVYDGRATVWHKVHGSTGPALNATYCYYVARNNLLFVWKHFRGIEATAMTLAFLLTRLAAAVKCAKAGQWKSISAMLRGLADAARLRRLAADRADASGLAVV